MRIASVTLEAAKLRHLKLALRRCRWQGPDWAEVERAPPQPGREENIQPEPRLVESYKDICLALDKSNGSL
jgi:hypothetical protein